MFDERYGQIGFNNTVILSGWNLSYGKPLSHSAAVGYKFLKSSASQFGFLRRGRGNFLCALARSMIWPHEPSSI
jgi:hypothetical protein